VAWLLRGYGWALPDTACLRRPKTFKTFKTRHSNQRARHIGAAFGGTRECEETGWANEIPYPIGAKITSRNWAGVGEKGLCSKDLREMGLSIEPLF
jgi:hypothetical protein